MANSTEQLNLLDPQSLAHLQNYQLLARTAVEGFLSGMHRSVAHGFGSEFLQYRNYTPGEDLKYLDWKVWAKSDRLYTKVFEEETNMNVYLILDASASMDYQGTRAPCSKLRYATMVAACIAYLATRQGDNISLFAYNNQFRELLPPGHRTGQLNRLLQALYRLNPEGSAAHHQFLPTLAETCHRGIVVFLSDMLEGENQLPGLLNHFRMRRCDTLALQVLDPDEKDLPQPRVTRYLDAESGAEQITYPEAARARYQEAFAQFESTLSQGFLKAQIDFLQVQSSESLGLILARYLSRRGR